MPTPRPAAIAATGAAEPDSGWLGAAVAGPLATAAGVEAAAADAAIVAGGPSTVKASDPLTGCPSFDTTR